MATPTLTVKAFVSPRTWYVAAGTTLSGYDPKYPNQAFHTIKFTENSSASADAEVWVSWNVSPAPIPRGGPFLRVTNGVYAGLLIVEALVTFAEPYLPSTNVLHYPARFQFGQSGAPCSGSSCCTDTCVQMLLEYWTEHLQTLANIRYWAQVGSSSNTAPCTGINPGETINALKHYGVNWYQAAFGIDAAFVKSKAAVGPVLVGVWYGVYPNNVSGRCGTTNEAHANGRTDCPFTGTHAVLVLGTNISGYMITRDPDHASAARPEKPPFDLMTLAQLDRTMKALPVNSNWSSTYCLYPTKKKTL